MEIWKKKKKRKEKDESKKEGRKEIFQINKRNGNFMLDIIAFTSVKKFEKKDNK